MIEDTRSQLDRQIAADADDDAAAVQADALRIRLGERPTYVSWCQHVACSNMIHLDDHATGGECGKCATWFCEDHGHPYQSWSDFERDIDVDVEAECSACRRKSEDEAHTAEANYWAQAQADYDLLVLEETRAYEEDTDGSY